MNPLLRFILRSLIRFVLTLVGVFILTFFVMMSVPGNPVLSRMERGVSAEQLEALQRESSLSESPLEKMGILAYRVFTLDFGKSLVTGEEVRSELVERLGNTFLLALLGCFFFLITGFSSAILGTLCRGSLLDDLLTIVTTSFLSTPVFWFALVLIYFFTIQWNLLPAMASLQNPVSLLLPALTVGLRPAAFFHKMLQQELLDIRRKAFMQVALAKGLSESQALVRHALKNAAGPAINIIGLEFGSLLTGAVVAETIFAYKGIGTYILQGIESRDYNIIAATVMVSAFAVMLVNLIVDIVHTILDPRLREEVQ